MPRTTTVSVMQNNDTYSESFSFDSDKLNSLKYRATPRASELRLERRVGQYDTVFLRHVPKQGRALDTFWAIVRVAEAVAAHPNIGFDLMTTAMIAEVLEMQTANADASAAAKKKRISKSIGTMYRYFEDIIAILDFINPSRSPHCIPYTVKDFS